ncbi:hypothetical protein MPHL43072_04715 [Mycolicibacterium phlei DSM 43072]|uniref:Uncharacterized protein n=1 Tax=Mycolicibacterium phlei DSM 43239 = CCUG 21000 TaxID=1226750 RepID=A0A5N5V497_MYCPH|nr:hypothetical protein [Mycolicibacterium phlei]KAB7756742.1 hypothetical protein MPHL21000_11540 [Mycolicibacterium phlei DSM 43239 = CCUG 21000]KXW63627.1 hypothetical protein MPHL43239_16690 [Mycolicibacterium phlei DSM 43239 = CCUG 21000]KXW66431.1 hypothetical protein MPHL43072_04715 [Mycolicibacterium phlei DSM 43072]KXW73909.1 hypothetical protein MPHL43070_09775 [Mycolicibacterium phlei DSM 43070]KXW75168.1 hypothetical protein JL15_23900 [Mycolicibacterium phlei DSM 43071]
MGFSALAAAASMARCSAAVNVVSAVELNTRRAGAVQTGQEGVRGWSFIERVTAKGPQEVQRNV